MKTKSKDNREVLCAAKPSAEWLVTNASDNARTYLIACDRRARASAYIDLRNLLNNVWRQARMSDYDLVSSVAELLICTSDEYSPVDVTEILCDCVVYFDSVGRTPREGLRLAKAAERFSQKLPDLLIKRRLHSILGTCYARAYNFEQACIHWEKAYSIAIQSNDPTYRLAALANIVCLIEEMGFLVEAKTLALHIAHLPDLNYKTSDIHLQNAANGLRLCHLTEDRSSSKTFYDVGINKSGNAGDFGITNIYFIAESAIYHAVNGDPALGINKISTALKETSGNNNLRIKAILHTAQANCGVLANDKTTIVVAITALQELLPKLAGLPFHYEQALEALVRSYSFSGIKDHERLAFQHASFLREYCISSRYENFVNSADDDINVSEKSFLSSGYQLLARKNIILAAEDSNEGALLNIGYSENTKFSRISGLLRECETEADRMQLRTRQFCVAENWAVAAEFICESDGRHCFRVALLASKMARLLIGMPAKKCTEIEFACRLHDIGKVAVNRNVLRKTKAGEVDDYLAIREHALSGERILRSSADPILQLGALVARHHHEWWNGCGYPDGLAGEEIPIAARLCAIADIYVTLRSQFNGQETWSHRAAMDQIRTMAGVQLDPILVGQLFSAAGGNMLDEAFTLDGEHELNMNQLAVAKRKLLCALEEVVE